MYRDVKNGWRTKTLFVEMCGPETREKYDPPFTLNEDDVVKRGKTYKSMYKLYMASVDEFDFVNTVLVSTKHWESLQKSKWFFNGHRGHYGVEKWREDMRARDESLAKKVLLAAVKEGDLNAAKKLFDVSKKPNETKRGRFVKEEAVKEAVKKAEDKDFLQDAASRLNVVNLYDS